MPISLHLIFSYKFSRILQAAHIEWSVSVVGCNQLITLDLAVHAYAWLKSPQCGTKLVLERRVAVEGSVIKSIIFICAFTFSIGLQPLSLRS